MLSSTCTPSRLAGLLIGSDTGERLPVLLVRARSADSGALLAETYSAADGQFALLLPLAGSAGSDFRLSLVVEVLDGSQAVLAEARLEIAPGEQASLNLTLADVGELVPAYTPAAAPSLVDAEAAAMLRMHVQDFVARGELPEQAAAVLEDALRPLEWTAALAPDAQAAMQGDPQAGARLRAALLAWSMPISDDEPLETLAEEDPADDESGEAAQAGLVNPDGLLPVALAAVYVSTNPREAQQMLDGLAAAVWSRPWVDLLYAAARLGDPIPMQTMMGGQMPGIPGIPGVPGFPGGKRPGGLGGPDWGNVPGKKVFKGVHVSPTVADIVLHFRDPINLPPSARERCLVGAMVEVAIIKQNLPHYLIRAFDNPDACAGQVLTITGEHFGKSGLVAFPGVAQPVAALQWSETSIQVIVPTAAAPGKIRLSIFEQRLTRCGKDFDIYRPGDTLPEFTGGVPQILSLWVNNVQGDTSAEPNTDVSLFYETSEGSGVITRLTVTKPDGTVIFQTPPQPGGVHSAAFRTPPILTAPDVIAGPLDLTVRVIAVGRCQPAQRVVTLTVTHQPDLHIHQFEVTQSIQRLDNTVRLAANRRTLARLYLDNGLGLFSYTGKTGELPGVTGSITLWRGAQKLAVVSPTPSVITSRIYFQPGGRETLSVSLNFWLPAALLSGPLRLEMRVWLAAPPHGVLDGPHTNDVRFLDLNFEPTNHARIVQVRMQDNARVLPAPSANEYSAALAGARGRYPIPDDGFEIFLPPGGPVLQTNQDLTSEDGWSNLLEDLDTIAEDTAGAWNLAWCGVIAAEQPGVPDNQRLALNGIGRQGNGKHDYSAMTCQAGLPATFAHELSHVYGFGHAGCADPGTAFPTGVDASLPAYIEETALDLFAMPIKVYQAGNFGAGDLMSYCGGPNRWTSVVLWHKFMDLLKV